MKRNFGLVFILLLIALCFSGCNKKEVITDSPKFKSEYTSVSDNNIYVYKDIDEILKILDNGTGIIYFGFPECPWCQAYVPMLDEVAKENGLDKIYYYNIYNDRKDNTENYEKIVEKLDEYLTYDNEGNKRVYVPAVIGVLRGKIVGFDDETAYDTKGYENPSDYWNDDAVSNLKDKLTQIVKDVNVMCNDCNK